jgi:hypothetical protein
MRENTGAGASPVEKKKIKILSEQNSRNLT